VSTLRASSSDRQNRETKREKPAEVAKPGGQNVLEKALQPFEIFPSLWGKCLRQVEQNFLISNFSAIVRLFFVVT
jgi:hypothetical protein